MKHDIDVEQGLYDIFDDDLLVNANPTNLIRGVVYKLLVAIRVENRVNLYRGIRFSVQGRENDNGGEWVCCETIGKAHQKINQFRLKADWEISVMAEREYPDQQLFAGLKS